MSDAGDRFSRVVTALDHPMWIVTTVNRAGEHAGCLIGFATQCSIRPPRFLACLSVKNRTHAIAAEAEVIAVHPVSADERDLAELFGGETGDEVDKFTRCEWRVGPGGVRVLATRAGWFAGRVIERVALGDHTGCLLDPIDAEVGDRSAPELGYQTAKGIDPGHAP